MDVIAALPLGFLVVLVFLLRVADVTLGTVRTVTIVKGYVGLSMVLGFLEVAIWVGVLSQVLLRLSESWMLVVAYAGGFAAGNGVGILLERKLALGMVVARIISADQGDAIAAALRGLGHGVTTFVGHGGDSPVTLVYVAGRRRDLPLILRTARAIDPDLFYVTEAAHETGQGTFARLRQVPHATGWRATFKKK